MITTIPLSDHIASEKSLKVNSICYKESCTCLQYYTCVCKLLQQRISSLTGEIVVKAIYITVHLYDILVINTRPHLRLA